MMSNWKCYMSTCLQALWKKIIHVWMQSFGITPQVDISFWGFCCQIKIYGPILLSGLVAKRSLFLEGISLLEPKNAHKIKNN